MPIYDFGYVCDSKKNEIGTEVGCLAAREIHLNNSLNENGKYCVFSV